MKFQNSSIHGFKVMLCIKKSDERTDGRTDGRTNNPEAICPSNFIEVGGIMRVTTRARENRKNSRSGPKLRILDRFQTPQNANKSVQHFSNQPIFTNQ